MLLAELILFGAAYTLGEIGRGFHLSWDGFRKNMFVT